ncbi:MULTISPECIES: glucose-1-phosphate adenylyltransferase subunit GlgD [unclassified Fusibacter]|uniref:glucose-1-phosphate adenylyltransferase subunit GlgD n=1 Tax=unclassified Fusibacter TaxID=2624464 RepID=UPI001013AB2E|nr:MULTISPECIES: glucose-1-phosphate adenylyltransferase subunit GlgD [unclassified Fusibacter]MCK8061437.1 glucose-1-phosphate adenylyltransferase subunit GlgD [Fusibacter sp. A2]NPE23624.1 glucose-1-phosphate adenylyltransferase subunit GlgD [Fusibacter sp. A1]RXV58897.1 glucose-1-phosphate adenylyltransferase subunit GlgD [Fusibacter sp. A1]
MSKDVMGIINLSENEEKIKDLTLNRPIAALPFAGRYRVIDFTLSNMVNSDIQKVAIFTKHKFRSLQDHLGPGKYWNLDRKRDGLYMLHPMVDYSTMVRKYGDLENFKNNLGFIAHAKQEYVLISRSYMIMNIDYSPAIEYHKESGADLTIICKHISNGQNMSQYIGLDLLDVDENLNVNSIGLNFGSKEEYCLSMESYIMKRDLLVEIITEAYQSGNISFLKEAVFSYMDKLKVNAFPYSGPSMCMNTISNYYKSTLDLLDRRNFSQLFDGPGRIYTKIKDEPSAFYSPTSSVTNSIVANGCIIEGTVENSVIFRGVHIKKGAIVRNSIIMQDAKIGETAHLNYVIADKNVTIGNKKILMGDGGIPFVIKKSQVI